MSIKNMTDGEIETYIDGLCAIDEERDGEDGAADQDQGGAAEEGGAMIENPFLRPDCKTEAKPATAADEYFKNLDKEIRETQEKSAKDEAEINDPAKNPFLRTDI